MRIGLIDYYLDEPHAKEYHRDLPTLTDGKVEVTCGYGEIPAPKTGKSSEEWCAEKGITCYATPEEVVANSDGIIVLAPDHSHKHEELADAALRSGKPVFVDKTFAPDLAAARRMFDLAAAHGTPLCTFSALRYPEEYDNVNLEGLTSASMWGGGGVDTYSIHQLEPLVMLLKAPGQKLLFTQNGYWYNAVIQFADGKMGTITGGYNYHKFSALLQWEKETEKIDILSRYFNRSITAIGQFMLNGKADFDSKETLWIMALRTALLEAQKNPGVWVDVPQI
ncbi:MAG: Gfo/Idh/MocA family oxidoreductase [Clostridia bacterium]|nr:Gfo/Idh/MocA family oxidoreductase [Clostridia bacterium]